MKHVTDYFSRLAAGFGQGWTRFWFIPRDPATLSVVRVLTGLVAVYLHATLAFDLVNLFGPDGLLPASDIGPIEGDRLSYLYAFSQPGELWAVHLIGLALLALFTIGLWTRVTTVLALVVFLSDVNRAPMITSLTEPIVAMVMFYLCFAPSGAWLSIDSLLARRSRDGAEAGGRPAAPSTMATIATRLIQVHLAMLVAMMGLSKLMGETWWSGEAMWWLIARYDSRMVDFTRLRDAPQLVDLWAHVVVLFELAFPVLIWVPLARPLLLGLGVVVWTSLALVTGDVPFALMMCIASLAFVPPTIARAIFASRGRQVAST